MGKSNYSYGFTFNGHHSTDFGVDVGAGKVVGFPAKNMLTVPLANSNSVIDLSNLYGPTYGERTLQFPMIIVDHSIWTKESMYRQWTRVVNWLMQPQGKTPLVDDLMSDYHYLAEVETAPDFQELAMYGTLTITFTCYPFRIKNSPEFDDIWDTFNFDMDVAQITKFTVGGHQSGMLINLGVSEVPVTVTASDAATLTINGVRHDLVKGTNTDPTLVLAPGDNTIGLYASDIQTAVISWYSEVI